MSKEVLKKIREERRRSLSNMVKNMHQKQVRMEELASERAFNEAEKESNQTKEQRCCIQVCKFFTFMWDNLPIGVIKLPLFTSSGNQEYTSCAYKSAGLFLIFMFVSFSYYALQ